MHCQRLGALPSFRLRGVNEGGGSAHALGGIGKWSTHVMGVETMFKGATSRARKRQVFEKNRPKINTDISLVENTSLECSLRLRVLIFSR